MSTEIESRPSAKNMKRGKHSRNKLRQAKDLEQKRVVSKRQSLKSHETTTLKRSVRRVPKRTRV